MDMYRGVEGGLYRGVWWWICIEGYEGGYV